MVIKNNGWTWKFLAHFYIFWKENLPQTFLRKLITLRYIISWTTFFLLMPKKCCSLQYQTLLELYWCCLLYRKVDAWGNRSTSWIWLSRQCWVVTFICAQFFFLHIFVLAARSRQNLAHRIFAQKSWSQSCCLSMSSISSFLFCCWEKIRRENKYNISFIQSINEFLTQN